MDWEKFALNFGLPGLMLGVIFAIAKLWIASSERIQLERVKVDDKRADATVAALTSLGGKIDSHQIADIKSHQEMAEGLAELHGAVNQALADRATPIQGVPVGQYGPRRPGTGSR